MKIHSKDIIYIFIIVVIFFLYFFNMQKEAIETRDGLISSLTSEVEIYKDKEGNSRARIEVLETENQKQFLKLKSKDSTIQKLQHVVKAYKKQRKKVEQATVINTITKAPIRTTIRDTFYIKESVKIPTKVFVDSLDGWVKVEGEIIDDSLQLDLETRNEYSVVVFKDKQGLFKKPKYYSEVTNFNPFTETETVRTYKTSGIKDDKIIINAGIGYAPEGIQPTITVGYKLFGF